MRQHWQASTRRRGCGGSGMNTNLPLASTRRSSATSATSLGHDRPRSGRSSWQQEDGGVYRSGVQPRSRALMKVRLAGGKATNGNPKGDPHQLSTSSLVAFADLRPSIGSRLPFGPFEWRRRAEKATAGTARSLGLIRSRCGPCVCELVQRLIRHVARPQFGIYPLTSAPLGLLPITWRLDQRGRSSAVPAPRPSLSDNVGAKPILHSGTTHSGTTAAKAGNSGKSLGALKSMAKQEARLRTHSQKSTVAARAMADRKTVGH